MRVIFFGMPGPFAAPPLRALLASGAELAALAMPAPPGAGPVTRLPPIGAPAGRNVLAGPPPTLAQIAQTTGAPVLGLRGLGRPEVAAALAELRPDLACVACWPWRIPPTLLALPRHGFLNLHPSLLPDLRGPEPLFWAFQRGLERSGVSLHRMDAGLDTGPILAQAEMALPLGMAGPAAEARAAELGAGLLAAALADLLGGAAPPARPQPPGGGFYPAPSAADFGIDRAWPARRAYHFMRGTAHWRAPYPLLGAELLLAEAVGYEPQGELGRAYICDGAIARVQCSPGLLIARIA
jgi:methionyl-tRNA formyltransferase